jgi:uncharacterized membrane protein
MKVTKKWDFHPAVRNHEDLTRGERAADVMRNGMGSWGFVFSALGFLAIWMTYNGKHGFDPYPFILLNLLLSCLAAMQGAILLIAAKRSDQISSELASHTFQVDQENLALTKQIAVLSQEIHNLTQIVLVHVKQPSGITTDGSKHVNSKE